MNTHSADALRLEGVTKTYGSAKAPLNALDGVDLTVPSGQLFGLIGHNGAGKSTLFKLVLGLIRPSRGQIRISGSLVNGPDFRAVRRTLGYLPENLVLYDNLSGLETLRFFARLKGAPERQCGELLDRVGPLQDDYFIDRVDVQWCLRARHLGLAIAVLSVTGMVIWWRKQRARQFASQRVERGLVEQG